MKNYDSEWELNNHRILLTISNHNKKCKHKCKQIQPYVQK